MAKSKDDSKNQGEGFTAPGITDLHQRLSRALGEAVKGPTRVFSSAAGELAKAALDVGLAGSGRGAGGDSSGTSTGYRLTRSAESIARAAGSAIVETAHVVEDTAEVFVFPAGYGDPAFVKTGNRLYPMAPHRLDDVTLHAFFPEVNQKTLQEYLDKVFKEPTGGAVQLRPACKRLVIFAADMGRVTSDNPDENRKGHTSDIDVAIWAFAIRTRPLKLPNLLFFVPIYHFVGKVPTLAAGREIFGFPKQDAVFRGFVIPEHSRSADTTSEDSIRDRVTKEVLEKLEELVNDKAKNIRSGPSRERFEEIWSQILDDIGVDDRNVRDKQSPKPDDRGAMGSVELLDVRPWTLSKSGDESEELKRRTVIRITGGVPKEEQKGLDIEALFKEIIKGCLEDGSIIKEVLEDLNLEGKTDDVLRLLGIDPENFVNGRIPMLFLKQVPSAENSAKCAYQAVVESSILVKKLGPHGIDTVDHLHLELPGPRGGKYYPTHPFDEFGIEKNNLSNRVFWMRKSILQLEDGKVIWHSPP